MEEYEGLIQGNEIQLPVIDITPWFMHDTSTMLLKSEFWDKKAKDIEKSTLPSVKVIHRRTFITIPLNVLYGLFNDWCELTHYNEDKEISILSNAEFFPEMGVMQIMGEMDLLLNADTNIFSHKNNKVAYKKTYKLTRGYKLHMCIAEDGRTRFLFSR